MLLKYLLISATALSITLSGVALAKKPEDKGNPHSNGSDARWENSNNQSDEYSSRGRERAEERHRLKESKKHREKKYKHKKDKYDKYNRRDKDEYYERGDDRSERKHDRYERQPYKETHQNDSVDTIIDRNVDEAKSIIDDAHRKTIESIDNKSRELMGGGSQRDRTKSARSLSENRNRREGKSF